MDLQVVGAGLGRTGTHSLKLALEQLLGGPCYHMVEVMAHPEHIAIWQRAVEGDPPDWNALFDGYRATVDWPAAAFWRELSSANPDAIVLLSQRDTEGWWQSASHTIFEVTRHVPPGEPMVAAQMTMARTMLDETFTPDWQDERAAKAAYEAHNRAVVDWGPADRLVVWHPGDGWDPICAALRLPVPDAPFPHVNTTDEFRTRAGLDAP